MYKLKTYEGITYEIYGKEFREEKLWTAVKEVILGLLAIAALFALAYVACGTIFCSISAYHGYKIF